MALVWFRMLPGAPKRSVQLPAEVRHRSVDGDSLLLTPSSSREVTEDEWQHIQSAHPDLLPHIVVKPSQSMSRAN